MVQPSLEREGEKERQKPSTSVGGMDEALDGGKLGGVAQLVRLVRLDVECVAPLAAAGPSVARYQQHRSCSACCSVHWERCTGQINHAQSSQLIPRFLLVSLGHPVAQLPSNKECSAMDAIIALCPLPRVLELHCSAMRGAVITLLSHGCNTHTAQS